MITARDIEKACILQALRRVARQLSRRYEDALKPVDLTAGQFSILAALLREKPAPLTGVAEGLGMDRTTLTRNLRPLERRGLVSSMPCPDDHRVRALSLTPKGRGVLEQALPLWQAAQAEAQRKLEDSSWDDVRDRLDRLVGSDAA